MGSAFLRWVGGKTRLIPRLREYLPSDNDYGTYYEPFLGAGAVFFELEPRAAVLGDANRELVQCFRWVRKAPVRVGSILSELAIDQSEASYYLRRMEFNSLRSGVRKAALFIYLNKTCFNGVWRVNRSGEFNVPYGAKRRPGFPDTESLRSAALLLRGASLRVADFEETLNDVARDDFVFLDPPYRPLSDTAFFRHYTQMRFGDPDHKRVRDWVHDAAKMGVRFLLTVSSDDYALGHYKSLQLREWPVQRYVSGSRARSKVQELIVRNW